MVSLITLEQSYQAAIDRDASENERLNAVRQYASKLRSYVEDLSRLGISIRVAASSRSREAAVKGLVFNNEIYSVCTNVPVEIELIMAKDKRKNDGDLSFEEGPINELVAQDAESASENELNPTKGMYIYGFCTYKY